MNGFEMLDVLLGVVLVYFLLSLVAASVREGAESILQARAVHLERGIRRLLGEEPADAWMQEQVYRHPLVAALMDRPFTPVARRIQARGYPAYIPARSFAVALLDVVAHGPEVYPRGASGWATLEERVAALPNAHLRRALQVAMDDARGDMGRLRANVEAWFDSAMERVSGGYKRYTQYWLFAIGLTITVALNVNTITIANHLARDDAARAALAARAAAVAQDPAYRALMADTTAAGRDARARMDDLASLDLPIGWDREPPATGTDARATLSFWMRRVLGLLLTAFAVTLGAPFWFDVLGKVARIRSTVKPREKAASDAPEEEPLVPRTRPAAPVVGAYEPPAVGAAAAVALPAGVGAPEHDPEFTPHAWADGHPEEGIL